jgi:hypothetical protein
MKRLAIAMLVAVSAFARADASSTNEQLLNRLLRQGTVKITPSFGALAEGVEQPFEFDFGLLYANPDGSGDSWEVPLALSYQFNKADSLAFSSGYLRNDDGTHSHAGSDNFTLLYQHLFTISETTGARLSAGAIVPSGGAVGSSTATQFVQGSLGYQFVSSWTLGGSASLIHVDSVPSGIGNTGERYAASLGHDVTETIGYTAKLFHDERSGIPGTTTAEFEYDFPLSGPFSGALIADYGLTSEHHDAALELDIACRW